MPLTAFAQVHGPAMHVIRPRMAAVRTPADLGVFAILRDVLAKV